MNHVNYVVTGMTCDHCARFVTEEISQISGVSDVSVDLPTGTVTISSTEALDKSVVRAAVTEAGSKLVDH